MFFSNCAQGIKMQEKGTNIELLELFIISYAS